MSRRTGSLPLMVAAVEKQPQSNDIPLIMLKVIRKIKKIKSDVIIFAEVSVKIPNMINIPVMSSIQGKYRAGKFIRNSGITL